MLLHLQRMQDFYGPEEGLVRFRKHVTRYISLGPLSREHRTRLLTCTTAETFTAFLAELSEDPKIFQNSGGF